MLRNFPRRVLVALLLLAPTFVATTGTTGPAGATTTPNPTIHYSFDGTLLDSGGASTLTEMPTCPTVDANACNATTTFGSDADGGYWQWTSTAARGGGFRILSDRSIGDSYTLTMKFSFDQTGSGYKKIIDFLDRGPDTGFYFRSGNILFYNLGSRSSQVYPDGTVLDLVAVRQSTGGTAGTFTVYAKTSGGALEQLISISDPTGESIPFVDNASRTLLGFFFDDTATSAEATNGGRVYDIKIWENTALSPEQVEQALLPPSPPSGVVVTPGDGSLLVSWDEVPDATSYTATASPGGQSCTVAAPATSCTITGVANGSSYSVTVTATGPGGTSTSSTAATGVPEPAPTTTTAPATDEVVPKHAG